MWFGVWLNYFQCQLSSGACVPTWTCIALILLSFMCYVVLCRPIQELHDDLIVDFYFYGHLSACTLLTLTVIARSRPMFLVCCKYYLCLLVYRSGE